MPRQISLFSGYEQRENRTTNYCLLVLRLLYEESPKLLSRALASIAGESVGDAVGVQFVQQQRLARSVPDGLITQLPFNVFIETKHFDWFHDDQLERHLDALNRTGPGVKVLIALSNFEGPSGLKFQRMAELCATKYRGDIVFTALSFEDFADALPQEHVSPNLADVLLEFSTYLAEAGLLPRSRHLLDVVNCAGSSHIVLDGNAYICPLAGGAYAHRECQYFGMYKEKRVSYVALIAAVVDIHEDRSADLRWSHVGTPLEDLLVRAREVHRAFQPGLIPARVFLLDDLTETDFRKGSKGGMMASKRYFDVEQLKALDAQDLAAKLRGRTWETLEAVGPER